MQWNDTSVTNGATFYYQITAANIAGESGRSAETSATPATVPGAPMGLTATTNGDGYVALTWAVPSSDGGKPITGYALSRGNTSGGEVFLTDPGVSTGYNDSGLTGGQSYFYKIAARNSIGTGVSSDEASAIARTHPGVPTGLTVVAGVRVFNLSWTAPTSTGGSPITGYDIYSGSSSGFELYLTTTGAVTSTQVNSGNGQTTYFQVAARNAINPSSKTPEASATTPSLPGSPTGLSAAPSAGRIDLAWSPPASDGGRAVTAYDIFRSTSSGGETLLSSVGNVTAFANTGLPPGQPYFYEVRANTGVGTGAMSSETTATTPTPPATPVASTSPRVGGINISWAAPFDGGSPITSYQIWRSTTTGTETPYANTGLLTSYNDSGVVANGRFYYKIQAVNAVGTGPLGAEVSDVPWAIPNAPASPTISSGPAAGQISLSWPAAVGTPPATSYRVFRSTTSGTETLVASLGSVHSYKDTGLTKGLAYYYTISATNSVGESSRSGESRGVALCWSADGDCFVNATSLSMNRPLAFHANDTGASTEDGEPLPACATADRTLWLTFTAATEGTAHIDQTDARSLVPVIQVYSGTDLASLTRVACGAASPSGTTFTHISFACTAQTTYHIQVAARSGLGDANFTLDGCGSTGTTTATDPAFAGVGTHQSSEDTCRPPLPCDSFDADAAARAQTARNPLNDPRASGATATFVARSGTLRVDSGRTSITLGPMPRPPGGSGPGGILPGDALAYIGDAMAFVSSATIDSGQAGLSLGPMPRPPGGGGPGGIPDPNEIAGYAGEMTTYVLSDPVHVRGPG